MKKIYFFGIRTLCGIILFMIGWILRNDYVEITGGLTVTLAIIDSIEDRRNWNSEHTFLYYIKEHIPLILIWVLVLTCAAFDDVYLFSASIIISFFLREVLGYYLQKFN